MSRTIETIAAQRMPVKHPVMAARPKQFNVSWQNGFESGGQVQRKLRLTLIGPAAQPAN